MKILSNNTYLLLIDEEAEIKEGDIVYRDTGIVFKITNENISYYKEDIPKTVHKIYRCIAYYPLSKESEELDLPLLPPFEVDIEKLAEDRYGKYEASIDIPNKYLREGFIDGYKAAQTLNKQISLEDIKKAFNAGEEYTATEFLSERSPNLEQYIQSLSTQQFPVSFEPEYEITYKEYKNGKKELISVEFHKITNSEGKEFLVGTYKY